MLRKRRSSRISEKNNWKKTPLQLAVLVGDLKSVKSLVEEGAEVNEHRLSDKSPLLIACGSVKNHHLGPYYHEEIAKYLIENGAKINVRDGNNMSPLDFSCKAGNYEVVKQLIDRFADIKVIGKNATLHCAVSGGNPRIVQLIVDELVARGMINLTVCYTEGSPLTMAIRKMWNHPNVCEIVEILLRAGIDVHATGSPSTAEIPLHIRSGDANSDTLYRQSYRKCVIAGQSIMGSDEYCPLHHYSMNAASPVGLLKLLLKYKANINAQCWNGTTPLENIFCRFFDPDDLGNSLTRSDEEKIDVILDHVSNMERNCQNIISINLSIIDHYQKIKPELMLMKKPISELNGCSAFDIVSKNIDIAGRILENKSIDDILSSLVDKLPFYGDSLRNKFSEIHTRRRVFLLARDVFAEYICSYKLPLELVEMCCMLLPTNDLRKLSNVVKMEG